MPAHHDEGGSDSDFSGEEGISPTQRDDQEQKPKRAPEGRRAGRSSVRQRNNKRVQELKDTARIRKRLSLTCTHRDWDAIIQTFKLYPAHDEDRWDPSTLERCANLRSDEITRQPNDYRVVTPPFFEVDGLKINARWTRHSKREKLERGHWTAELLDIREVTGGLCAELEQTLGTNLEVFTAEVLADSCRVLQEAFQEAVDRRMREAFAEVELVRLSLSTEVKLKVELFEVRLPDKKHGCKAIHSYVGHQKMKGMHPAIPPYVPDTNFLNLGGAAHCWIARTSVWRGRISGTLTEYEVGPEHCFLPSETVAFRTNDWCFEEPVWVVSAEEEEAFKQRGVENFLIKKTLKKGDRFVLYPAFDRRATHRENWRQVLESEVVDDILEINRQELKGFISPKVAEYFALAGTDENGSPKKVRVLHEDCTCLNIKVKHSAIVGIPVGQEKERGEFDLMVAAPKCTDEERPVQHYMDLRGRLGFNAMGLLHRRSCVDDLEDDVIIECPLNRVSVMYPNSLLLFLDHWRDEQEQKTFRRALEKINEEKFLQSLTGGEHY